MARIPDAVKSRDPQVIRLLNQLKKKRGRIDGMYRSLLNHPELAKLVSDLGTYLRFRGKLPGDLRELTILYTSRKRNAAYEWTHHIQHALDNGVPATLIERIRTRKPLLATDVYGHTLKAVQHVLQARPIPAQLQRQLVSKIGVEGVIELVVLAGFYSMIADILYAFDVPLPKDMKKPF